MKFSLIYIYIFLILFMLFKPDLYSQEKNIVNDITGNIYPEAKNRENGKNVNIDARMLYGQKNNIDTSFSIIQNLKNFAYQLNSNLMRSNDFGYKNSSFYESEIGFTGKADLSDTWKLTPELEVNNESHGMFDNPVYSREEKDKVIIILKNEYRPTPSRWNFNVGGAQYVHRLISATGTDVKRNSFNKINEEIGWEYIWSASNKIGLKHDYSHYFYSPSEGNFNVKDDKHINNEIFMSFKVVEYIKVEAGFIIDWNKDLEKYKGWFPSARGNISSVGLKYALFEFSYDYNLIPFNPEDFYFEQKYISPNYELLPAKVRNFDLKGEFDFRFNSKSRFYVKHFRLKGTASYKDNDNFYNYYPISGNVLSAEALPVRYFRFKSDMITDVKIYDKKFRFVVNYEHYRYSAERNITYRPANIIGGMLNFSSNGWEFELDNKLIGSVFINPDPDNRQKLDKALIGSFRMQLKMVDSFLLYAKINNIYNSKYSYRDGYYEPGITFLGGLRIII